MEPGQKEDGDGTLSQHDIASVPVADVEGALSNLQVITFGNDFSGSVSCSMTLAARAALFHSYSCVFQLLYYRVQS